MKTGAGARAHDVTARRRRPADGRPLARRGEVIEPPPSAVPVRDIRWSHELVACRAWSRALFCLTIRSVASRTQRLNQEVEPIPGHYSEVSPMFDRLRRRLTFANVTSM